MELRQLTDFLAVADHGTVTAAAEALHLAQPSLSVQLQQLEAELGCPLFDRSGRRLRLTAAGVQFYQRAAAILSMCDSAQREMADLGRGAAGTLRLGAVSSVSSTRFLSWLEDFRFLCPQLRVELHEGNTYQLLEQVRSRQIELALVRTPFSATDLAQVTLLRESMQVLGGPALPEGPLTLADLADTPLILYRRWEAILLDAFREADLTPRVFAVCDDARTAVRMAERGFGAAIVPRSILPAGTPARELDHPGLTSTVCAVHGKDTYLSSLARRFLDCIRGEPNSSRE